MSVGLCYGRKYLYFVTFYVICNNQKEQKSIFIVRKGCRLYSTHQKEKGFYTSNDIFCDIIFHSLTEPQAQMRICRINDWQLDGEAEKHIIGMFLCGKNLF